MKRLSLVQALTGVLSFATTSAAESLRAFEPPSVNSTSGLLIGHKAEHRPNSYEFLGVKYGQAPTGELRFASPKRYVAPEGTVFEAFNWNADCPAGIPPVTTFPNFTGNGFDIFNQFTAHLGNRQDEDCLALNIWTKLPSKPQRNETGKPVFVFFHGGRFTIPGPHSPFYSGQYFADNEDVVVVTVNYRLGIFGFSGAPGIEQNAGLRDQRSAVEWVKDNILGFGGDPNRIIIFGQSAGGAAVDYWAYAYQHDPIVAGMISHSGTALSYIPNSPEYSQLIYHNVSTTLGCGNSIEGQDTLSCLRQKNVTEILAAARSVPALPTQALAQATFHPTVDNITVFADYAALGAAGSFAKIPYLAGSGDYEAGFYRVSAFGANVSLSPDKWELFNERAFTCPTKYANDFRVAHDVSTWRYRYMGDFDNIRLYDSWGDYPNSGSYHGSDLTALFGTAEDVTGEPSSDEQQRFSRYMQGAWAAFGRDPVHGLESYGWPSYAPSTSSLVLLANDNQAKPAFVPSGLYDEDCPPVSENDPTPGRGAF